jgi:hypothetical protein
MPRAVRSWRSRVGTVIALGAFALGAAGIGWAATRAADAGAITACVEPASNALFYSTNGTCPGGQTTVVWNETGPQGAPGAPGPQGLPGASATQGMTFGPSKYTNGFTISGTVTARGNYAFEGTVEREQATTVHPGRNFQVICSLLSGPPNGSATQLTSTTQTFVYNRKTKTYEPNGYDGPTGLDVAQFVQANQVPLVVYYTCKRTGVSGRAYFTHPALALVIAQSLHLRVGPALPVQHIVGPGPLSKVGGGG